MADRRVSVAIDADTSGFARGLAAASAEAKGFSRELESADAKMNGLVQAGLALAPAMVPLGAAAIPAIAGLTAELGAAAAAMGVAALAFHGIGDALDAVNKYHLDPTEANLQKMQTALAGLGPAGAQFVTFLDSLRPRLEELQALARAGMFPGLEEGIRSLLGLMPELETLVSSVATEMGKLASEAGKDLAGPGWRAFFDYISREAAPTLSALGHTLGNVAGGLANLVVAFGPLSSDFATGMERMSRSFADWAAHVSSTAGFQEFVDYVRTSGPLAMQALESVANALVSVVEAAAPIGQATLPAISALADVLASIAKSSAGPALIGTAAGVAALAKAAGLLGATGILSGGEKGLGKAFASAVAPIRDVSAATAGLRAAEEELAQAALAARDAQFALIPTSEKRAALGEFTAAQQRAALAADGLAAAEGRLSRLNMGLTFAATIAGAVALTDALDNLFNMHLDGTNLDRSLTALSDGRVTGAMLSQFGGDLAGFGKQAYLATSAMFELQRASAHMPLIGHMLAGGAGDAVDNMKQLDQALAALVEGGQASQAEAAFKRLAASAKAQGVSMKDLKGLFPEYGTALANAAAEAKRSAGASTSAAGATDRFASATRRFTAETDANSKALLNNIDAMRKQRSAALAGLNAQIGYQQSLDDARAALAKNGKTLDITTQKGRDNKTALLAVAAAWNQESDAAKNAPGAHRAAIRSFVNLATQMGMSTKAAQNLAKRILEIPSKKVNITADASQALRTIAQINYAHIADKSFTITTYYDAIRRDSNMANFAPPPGSKHATGGYISGPGGPTSDSIPAWLSNGEYVIRAAAVNELGVSFLDHLNAQGFARGGLALAAGGTLRNYRKKAA